MHLFTTLLLLCLCSTSTAQIAPEQTDAIVKGVVKAVVEEAHERFDVEASTRVEGRLFCESDGVQHLLTGVSTNLVEMDKFEDDTVSGTQTGADGSFYLAGSEKEIHFTSGKPEFFVRAWFYCRDGHLKDMKDKDCPALQSVAKQCKMKCLVNVTSAQIPDEFVTATPGANAYKMEMDVSKSTIKMDCRRREWKARMAGIG